MLTLNRIAGAVCLLGCLALGGCVSAHKLDQALAIPIGMNEVQVVNKIGEPPLKDQEKDGTERWIWSRKGQFGSESVTLIMKDGRVAAIESVGERLKHLEDLARLKRAEERLEATARGDLFEQTAPPAKEPVATEILVVSTNTTALIVAVTNASAVAVVEEPTFKHEKSSEEIWREHEEALAAAQSEARGLEEQTRALVEKARLASATLEVPPLTAWYMARQIVSEGLADQLGPTRTLFPNPRFSGDSAGEERVGGNVWRTWGYVETVDSSNARKRRRWTAELEFQGGTKWKSHKVDIEGLELRE